MENNVPLCIVVFDAVRQKGISASEGQEKEDEEDAMMTPEIEEAWKSFVKSSRVGEGKFWNLEDADEGFDKIQIEFEKDDT